MLTLIKNAQIYSPHDEGIKDVLIVGNRIEFIGHSADFLSDEFEKVAPNRLLDIIDLKGNWLVPGLVDSLVHITGGGGEAGFSSRVSELNLKKAIDAGLTTMVGALGTDSITRSIENVIAKARELYEGGLSVFCYTGSYHLPPKTLAGSVEKDIVWIPEIIGVGEVAIADHRTNQPSTSDLAKLAAEARVAGMVAGKKGIVSIHVGDGKSKLDALINVVEQHDIPITQFYPTHINRNQTLFEAGINYAKRGGFIDFTTSTTQQLIDAGEVEASHALKLALEQGVPLENITFSSDANASLPIFDNQGVCIDMDVGDPNSLWKAIVSAIKNHKLAPEVAISAGTLNPAMVLGLTDKGQIAKEKDADLLIIDKEDMSIESVMSRGVWLNRNN